MDPQVYDKWNVLKKALEQKYREHFIREREVYYVSLGKNVGYEVDGKNSSFERPVLVLKKFEDTFVCIPLTSQEHTGRYYYHFQLFGKSSTINLTQIRLLDVKRIRRRIGYLSTEDFAIVKRRLKRILGLG